jgi:Fic/DOC family N-terminal
MPATAARVSRVFEKLPQDFSSEAPGRLVRSLQGYWTYEPVPLPPPDDTLGLSFGLARELEDARGAIGELAGVGRMLPNPHLLIRPFIQREAVSSSRIEGTITRLDQLFLFDAEPDQVVHPADVEEVRNYVLACENGLDLIHQGNPLSLRVIREVHRALMQGVRGGTSCRASSGRAMCGSASTGSRGTKVGSSRRPTPR